MIVNGKEAETGPLAGFPTVTFAVPALAIKFSGTTAVSCVALTNVVASGEPFQ